jgi:L-ascorbate metabolism protein UlaG (beta-lactamase superfamily)
MRRICIQARGNMSSLRNVTVRMAFVVLATLFTVVAWGWSTPIYKGPVSDHFDGSHFYNEIPDHSFSDMVKWLWEMNTVEWPEWIDDPHQPMPVKYVNNGKLRITYINHATVMIQMDGLNMVTDPIWSKRAGPVSWLGTKRVRAPGVAMEDLPKIDVVLISHDHYDHLDMITLKQLAKRDKPLILAGLGIKTLLESEGFSKIIEMDWWQEYALQSTPVKFTFVPALHTSGRSVFEENRTLWGGFVIEGSPGKIYFAGDTGYDHFLDTIKERYVNFRLTIFPVGNYEKRWFMKNQHMNPDDAVRAHRVLRSKQSVGMHFGTFLEHPEQTIDAHEKDLATALKQHNVPESEFWILKFGEGRDVP